MSETPNLTPGALLDGLREQYAALRDALLAAGAGAPVPTCPGWDAAEVFRHLGRVWAWLPEQLGSADGTPDPATMPAGPDGFGTTVTWADEQLAGLVAAFEAHGPDAPAWPFVPGVPTTVGTWIRRMAHDTAIHRLDAEHARAGSADVSAVPELVFDPAFAADGVDELLAFLLPLPHPVKETLRGSGTLIVRAADAERAWRLRLVPGAAPECARPDWTEHPDLTVAGTADAVYRAVWKRPNNAVLSGDPTTLDVVPVP